MKRMQKLVIFKWTVLQVLLHLSYRQDSSGKTPLSFMYFQDSHAKD